MYVSNQPQLGFWKEAIDAVTKVAKQRKQRIAERAAEKERAQAMKADKADKAAGAVSTAGFGSSVSPLMLAGAAVVIGAVLWFRGRGRRRR
jgi:hypothetical protein